MIPRELRSLLGAEFLDAAAIRQWFREAWSPAEAELSSHERVTRALSHQAPDRVPFDFWAVPENWERLRSFFGATAVGADDVGAADAGSDSSGDGGEGRGDGSASGSLSKDDLLDLLGVDCRIISPDYIGPEPEVLPDGSFYSPWGSLRKTVSNEYSTYEEYAAFPLAGVESVAEVEGWSRWPESGYWDWKSLRAAAAKANGAQKRHLRYDIGGIFESAWALYGLDRFLMDLYLKPEIPLAIMDCYTELFIANFRSAMEAAGDLIDMVYSYDDVAAQDGLLMSPEMWREFILPFHKRLNAVIKEYDVKLIYHSCGAVLPLIEAFRDEMGIDVLNPLQPSAKGMDMALIKESFGDTLCFHGGGDLQHTFPFGTVDEVAAEADFLCRTLGREGGYICTSAHYIQADVPLKNILAFYGTRRSF